MLTGLCLSGHEGRAGAPDSDTGPPLGKSSGTEQRASPYLFLSEGNPSQESLEFCSSLISFTSS